MDAHLETIPGVRALTARTLTRGDLESLGRHANGTFYAKVLVLGAADKVSAHLLQALNVTASERDANALRLEAGFETGFLQGRHVERQRWRGMNCDELAGPTGDLREMNRSGDQREYGSFVGGEGVSDEQKKAHASSKKILIPTSAGTTVGKL